MNRDTAIAHAWKPITEPPEGGFVPGRCYLGGYWSEGTWINNIYKRGRHVDWFFAGETARHNPAFWQDDLPPPNDLAAQLAYADAFPVPVAVPPMPLEPPPGWQGGRLPPYTIPPPVPPHFPQPVTAAPARNLRTLAAFSMAGKRYLTMNEAIDMFESVIHDNKYITFNTPQGSWEPQFDTEYHNCIGYRFQRR